MTLDADAAGVRWAKAAKARDALAESYRQAKVASETCCAGAAELVDLAKPLLRQAESIQRHEAGQCWAETEQAREMKRQQTEAAAAMGKMGEKTESGQEKGE